MRRRDADNFALFGTHLHFGRTRLVASQPTRGPLIPANRLVVKLQSNYREAALPDAAGRVTARWSPASREWRR